MVGWSCLTGVMSACGSGCRARARLWDSCQSNQPDAAGCKGYQWGSRAGYGAISPFTNTVAVSCLGSDSGGLLSRLGAPGWRKQRRIAPEPPAWWWRRYAPPLSQAWWPQSLPATRAHHSLLFIFFPLSPFSLSHHSSQLIFLSFLYGCLPLDLSYSVPYFSKVKQKCCLGVAEALAIEVEVSTLLELIALCSPALHSKCAEEGRRGNQV
eukprot:3940920-Rhodomonas_salina.1